MTRTEMVDLVIRNFGFEDERTIQFAEAAEKLELTELETLLMKILKLPF